MMLLVKIIAGTDYSDADGTAIKVPIDTPADLSGEGVSITWHAGHKSLPDSIHGTGILPAASGGKPGNVLIEVARQQTCNEPAGRYGLVVEARLPNRNIVAIAHGNLDLVDART